jgi:hypothetical protein
MLNLSQRPRSAADADHRLFSGLAGGVRHSGVRKKSYKMGQGTGPITASAQEFCTANFGPHEADRLLAVWAIREGCVS